MPAVDGAAARRNRVVEDFFHFIRPIAERIHRNLPRSFELDDLMQLGACGLMDAAGSFDPDRQETWPAYARCRIRGAMLDGIRGREYRESTRDELPAGMVDPVAPSPLDAAIAAQAVASVQAAVAELPDRQRRVIEMRFIRELTQAAAGAELDGISQAGARELELRALAGLRRRLAA